MTELAGRTAFITGGAQGIGLAIARAFAGAGARLALVDVDGAALAAAEAELNGTTEVATAVLDVRDRTRYAEVADELEDRLGPVSVLCNNAGVGGNSRVADMSYPLWDLVVGVNLGGTINGIQTFLPRMIARGEPGHVVNTASAAGLAPMGGATGYLYESSKAGVIGLSEALGRQLAHEDHPIGVTVLCPGPVASNMVATGRAARAALGVETPGWEEEDQYVRRLGMPADDVGPMVLDAVRADRLYLLTDRTMAVPLALRAKALHRALPPETDHDRRVSDFVAAQTHRFEAGRTGR